MKTALCVLCLLGLARGAATPVPVAEREIRTLVAAELRQTFRYDPPLPPEVSEDDAAVLPLAPFEVFDSPLELGLKADRAIQRKQKQQAAEKFTWKKGGTILERDRVKVMFKYDPENDAVNLLKLAW